MSAAMDVYESSIARIFCKAALHNVPEWILYAVRKSIIA
jgi:hypothetical protein